MTSKIIFLNGCSSAGKTSLVKAIQMLGPEPWLTLGVDSLFATLPAKYFSDSPNNEKKFEGVQFIKKVDQGGFPIVEIKEGPYAKKFYQSVPKLVKQLVDDGHNLVIDEVI
jgi:chloramphenicol 3-O phosphotransferase